jgi:hypothetical protein
MREGFDSAGVSKVAVETTTRLKTHFQRPSASGLAMDGIFLSCAISIMRWVVLRPLCFLQQIFSIARLMRARARHTRTASPCSIHHIQRDNWNEIGIGIAAAHGPDRADDHTDAAVEVVLDGGRYADRFTRGQHEFDISLRATQR